ncbi:MAG: hypothetical protein ACJAXW_004444, partial [Candidatus Azotimanducaceae bacterium]
MWREICSLFAGNGIKKYAGSDLAFGQGNGVTMLLTAYEEKAL